MRACGWMISMHQIYIGLAAALWLAAALPISAEEIRGVVTDAADGLPLPGVNLHLIGTRLGAVSDTGGVYAIPNVPPGNYRLRASMVGYRTAVREDVTVHPGAVCRQDISLRTDVLSLAEMVVTPGRFAVLTRDPVVPQTLSRDEVQTMPGHIDDIYRTIVRLPGVTGSDYSARFNVRGGGHDQVLATLDGMELYEPFHLKDLGGGGLSIVDAEVIGGIDLMTGGFPADYGDHLSAVMAMTSRNARPGRRVAAGIGLANARLLAEGGTEDLGWLFSARRGYIDLVLKLIEEDEDDISPDYYDLFGKLSFGGDRHRFGLDVLWASDDFLVTEEDGDSFKSTYGNGYAWLTWDTTWGDWLHTRSLPYVGRLSQRREGRIFRSGALNEYVDDVRHTAIYGVKSDWKAEAGSRHLFRFGFEVKGLAADYDYFMRDRVRFQPGAGSVQTWYDTTRATLDRTGHEIGLYLVDRWRIWGPLTADAGVRYDRHSHTGEGRTSPRAALSLSLGDRTVVRAAWGRYFQAQGVADLRVEEGVTGFRRSEQATHYVLGVERRLGPGFQARIEAYDKDLRHIPDWYDNRDDIGDLLPELSEDRFHLFPEKGRVRGIEFYFKRDTGGRLNWWISYAYSVARETHSATLGYATLLGRTFPRRYDQRHAFSVDAIYRPSPKWSLSAAWQIHSGWPYTPLRLRINSRGTRYHTLDVEDFFSARYSAYHRLDVKLSRAFTFRRWRLFVSAEVGNLYNRRNIRDYWYSGGERYSERWLPRVPAFSVRAEF